MIMAVPENDDVKVDSSDQNLDNNTASLAATMRPPSPDDQNPESNSSVETPNSTKGSEGALKSEISHMDVKFSKLNPMAKEYVPQPLAPTLPVFVENSLWFTNSFAIQAFSAEDNDLFDTRRINFGQWKRRMSKKTSLAQKEDVIKRTVHVLDIDQQVTEEQLAGLFQSCGQVVDCRICGDNKSILRLAFIEFTDEEGARAALSLSGTLFGSYPIQVRLSKTAIAPVNPILLPKSQDEREKCAKTVYCTNIDKKVTQMELEDFFKAACGEIQHVRLIGDCHHQTCIAFVEFKLVESAVSALNCSGIVLGGLPLRVSQSKTPATEEQLVGLFQSCGQVVDCRICGDNKSILRLAFIEFTDEEGARSAVSLSGTLFGSYPIKVRLSKTAIAPVDPSLLPKSQDEREKCAKTVYCTNIDKKLTQMELEDFFKTACGEIQHVRLLGDCHHQTFFAFVEFKLVESAVSALNCSGIVLGGLPLRVSLSKTPVRLDQPDLN
ncbi:hypothetical protein F2Q69_00039885 [Brassica cretica]|uniref:RRM domain-containing protein n=1 Tax=Brassica cretica TaxID=69181 RepID=A0A8S9NEA2_BRACR|nr:hypothetical protein F2Q69_00039885 [Brassica cretica]